MTLTIATEQPPLRVEPDGTVRVGANFNGDIVRGLFRRKQIIYLPL